MSTWPGYLLLSVLATLLGCEAFCFYFSQPVFCNSSDSTPARITMCLPSGSHPCALSVPSWCLCFLQVQFQRGELGTSSWEESFARRTELRIGSGPTLSLFSVSLMYPVIPTPWLQKDRVENLCSNILCGYFFLLESVEMGFRVRASQEPGEDHMRSALI